MPRYFNDDGTNAIIKPGQESERGKEIGGHNIFADGVAPCSPLSPRHAATKQREMHGELTGSGMGFIETTAPRPVSGRKVVGRPTESRIFSQEALPVRRVSPRKQAALQGILGFTEAPKDTSYWRAQPSVLSVPWDNTRKVVDEPRRITGYATKSNVAGKDQVVFG